VVYELKHPFRDGTTHVLFEPLDFSRSRHPASRDISASVHVIARLAALMPRPRSHLIRFHGLFAPNAHHRRLVVPRPAPAPASEGTDPRPIAAILAHLETRAGRAPPPVRHRATPPAAFLGGALAKRARGTTARASWSSAWMPRRCA